MHVTLSLSRSEQRNPLWKINMVIFYIEQQRTINYHAVDKKNNLLEWKVMTECIASFNWLSFCLVKYLPATTAHADFERKQ